MFKITVTSTATSLWNLALTDINRIALMKQIDIKNEKPFDNLYIQNEGILDIRISENIIPTISVGINLSAGNENTYRMYNMKDFYLICNGVNTDITISGL